MGRKYDTFEVVIQNISKQSLDSKSKKIVHEILAYNLMHWAT